MGSLSGCADVSDEAPDPKALRSLAERLSRAGHDRDATPRTRSVRASSAGIAFRFAAELVSALLVGGVLGWGLDWVFGRFGFHTRPVFLLMMFLLGAAAGIRNVMRAAKEINDSIAEKDGEL